MTRERGRSAGRHRNSAVVLAGLGLLWVSALLATLLEGGDCGGASEACTAAAAVARDHVRLIVATLLAVSVLAIGALRMDIRVAEVALLGSSAALALLGTWVIVAENGRPLWLPAGFMFTIPAALVLLGGTARRLLVPRSVPER